MGSTRHPLYDCFQLAQMIEDLWWPAGLLPWTPAPRIALATFEHWLDRGQRHIRSGDRDVLLEAIDRVRNPSAHSDRVGLVAHVRRDLLWQVKRARMGWPNPRDFDPSVALAAVARIERGEDGPFVDFARAGRFCELGKVLQVGVGRPISARVSTFMR